MRIDSIDSELALAKKSENILVWERLKTRSREEEWENFIVEKGG